jgi:hypothetical protein
MISAKLKIFVILILSIFATTTVGVIFTNRQPSTPISVNPTNQAQSVSAVIPTQNIVVDSERAKYKTIPLENIKSTLQGTDPATLAVDAFDSVGVSYKRKVEVIYPQPNQALVIITQTNQAKNLNVPVRYRVELSSFGRTLFVSEPPMWQIVWAGELGSGE